MSDNKKTPPAAPQNQNKTADKPISPVKKPTAPANRSITERKNK